MQEGKHECKFLRPADQTCRLEGGKAEPDRCAGCRWKEEITDAQTLGE